MTITAAEQLLVELINRARLNPAAEAARMKIDLNQGLSAGTIGTGPQQVLAPNIQLEDAATRHSLWMLQADIFSHTGSGGSSSGGRMAQAGYVFEGAWQSGENISWSGTTGAVNLNTAIVQHYDSLFYSPGHRANTLNANYREIGVGQEQGQFVSGERAFNASMLTENFAKSGNSLFVTGVAMRDLDADLFYDIGEGRSGYWVSANGARATTQSAGGYTLEVPAGALVNGKVNLGVGSGVTTLGQLQVEVNNSNAKIDLLIAGDGKVALALSASGTLISGITEASLLGAANLTLSGTQLNDKLNGNVGRNVLNGGLGNDVLNGGGGNDTLNGGGGTDTLNGGAGNDAMLGGAGNDTYVVNAAGDRVFETTTATSTLDAGGTDSVRSSVTFSLDAYAGVRFVENLVLTGTANLNGTGNARVNALTGNAGNNVLYGGGGNDTLNGGGGSDTLNGGAGKDTFVFNTALGAGNIDRIADFSVVDDTIRLDDAIFLGLATGTLAASAFAANLMGEALNGSDRIVYETDTGRLSYDSDGAGGAPGVQFATLTAGLALTHADFFVF